jgi:hypothetical protein
MNDPRVDPSDLDDECEVSPNDSFADMKLVIRCVTRHDMVKLLLNDPRVNPSTHGNAGKKSSAFEDSLFFYTKNGALNSVASLGLIETVKVLLSDPRVIPSNSGEERKEKMNLAKEKLSSDIIHKISL